MPSATSRSATSTQRHHLRFGAVDEHRVGRLRAARGHLVAVGQRGERHERHAGLGVAAHDLDLDDVTRRQAGGDRGGPQADCARRRDGPAVVPQRRDHRQQRLLECRQPGRRGLGRRLHGDGIGTPAGGHRQGEQADQQQAQRGRRHDQHAAARRRRLVRGRPELGRMAPRTLVRRQRSAVHGAAAYRWTGRWRSGVSEGARASEPSSRLRLVVHRPRRSRRMTSGCTNRVRASDGRRLRGATMRPVLPPETGDDWLALTADELPVAATYDWAVRPGCGAVVLFSGTVRDHADGREGVEHLTYEAYDDAVVTRLSGDRDRGPHALAVDRAHRDVCIAPAAWRSVSPRSWSWCRHRTAPRRSRPAATRSTR